MNVSAVAIGGDAGPRCSLPHTVDAFRSLPTTRQLKSVRSGAHWISDAIVGAGLAVACASGLIHTDDSVIVENALEAPYLVACSDGKLVPTSQENTLPTLLNLSADSSCKVDSMQEWPPCFEREEFINGLPDALPISVIIDDEDTALNEQRIQAV